MYINQIQILPSARRLAEQVPRNFFFSRILEKNENDFQKLTPKEEFDDKLKELVQEQQEQISETLSDFGEPVSEVAQDVLFPSDHLRIGFMGRRPGQDTVTAAKYTGSKTNGPVLLLILEKEDSPPHRRTEERSNELKSGIIAKDNEDGEDFVGFFKNEVHEISKYVGDYAQVKDMISGGEIVHQYFDQRVSEDSTLADWYVDSESNAFEEEVYETVQTLTGISLSNVRIQSDIGDNPDFDVVALPLGDLGTGFAIEVKNYSQDDNERVDEKPAVNLESGELRSELIRKPKEYAEQANLELLTITKGLSDEQFDDLQRIAESSNISLFNEDNYEEGLHELLFEQRFKEMSQYVQ